MLTTPVGVGLSEAQHDSLNDLVHALAESYFLKVTRSAGKVTNVTCWTDATQTTKIRELQITRSGGKASVVVVIQYDDDGNEVQRMTGTISRTGSKVDSITWIETGG